MKPGKVLLFGLLGLIAAQVIAYFQQSANPLVSALLTIAAGAIPLLIDYAKGAAAARADRGGTSASSQRPDEWAYQEARPQPGAGGFIAGLLVLVLIGGGLAWGASYLFGWATGTEAAVPRLAKPVSGKAGALTVRVREVGVGAHTTQLLITATNTADFPVSIPMFSNCALVEPDTVALDAFLGPTTTSVVDVPANSVPVTKKLIFSGRPSQGATTLTLACSTLFWQGSGQPRSLQVKGIALKAG